MDEHTGLKILIVEDNAGFRQTLIATLCARFPFVTVFEAETLAEGQDKVGECSPDLVFLDIRLPDGNGLDLAERVRRELPTATVAVCTAYGGPEYAEVARQCGASHFIPKDQLCPQTIDDVIEEVLDGLR